MPGRLLSLLAVSCLISLIHCQTDTVSALRASQYDPRASQGKRADREAYLDDLVANMTVPELVLQLHIMFGDYIVGMDSDNGGYDTALASAPGAAIGVMHDWYPTNKSYYNSVQKLNLHRARLPVPFMQFGECLHGVGSFKQSMFPQSLGLSASFDTDLVYAVGRAIGAEARSIGIHACLAPVLDLGKDPRWGRAQEAWGEDVVLTSHMGVAYASGLSKNGSWSDPDAVVPVMKHFAAHGSPESGLNAAPFMGHGTRQMLEEMLVPFKAAVQLGGVKGVLMSYNELDDIPAHVHPMLYKALEGWGFDGFVTADDAGMVMLQERHMISDSVADTVQQYINAGGMIQYYDYPLEEYLNAIVGSEENGTLPLTVLQSRVRRILGVKDDLGLFDSPYIPDSVDSAALTSQHAPLTLEAAHKSIVLLENRNDTLPLKPAEQSLKKIALIGPFSDSLNYGDYSGQWGESPTARSSTIRQAVTDYLHNNANDTQLVTSWGANSWLYNAQYAVPGYLLSYNGTTGGLRATYYADTNFSKPMAQRIETPNMNWGLYPPPGLPSNNFSAIWEGNLSVPTDTDINGFIGVAVSPNTTASLYIDGTLVANSPMTTTGTIMSNIVSFAYSEANSTLPPEGGSEFTFVPGATHQVRIEFQAYNLAVKVENVASINAQIGFFWNLVDTSDPVGKAVETASSADVVLLAVGANWNSDGEGGDRATLGLSPNQTLLADAIFALNKPVILILSGGRPFAIPSYYAKAAAVLNAFFPGQSGGRAISDVIFGLVNPGGRVPISVPYDVGTLPAYYNYKQTARAVTYTDIIGAYPIYPFGYGLSYTNFTVTNLVPSTQIFHPNTSTLTFTVTIANTGPVSGSHVPQLYLLQRVSSITRPVRQLVAFQRVYLDAGEEWSIDLSIDVQRYLTVLDRWEKWGIETGEYVFALLENGGYEAAEAGGLNVTLTCV